MRGNNYVYEWFIDENESYQQHVFCTNLSMLKHVLQSRVQLCFKLSNIKTAQYNKTWTQRKRVSTVVVFVSYNTYCASYSE